LFNNICLLHTILYPEIPTTTHPRSECKALDRRSVLTPTTTKALLDAGYKVNVERSPERIFDDSEFEAVGATLVPKGSWVDAPHDHIIIGLGELPEDKFALKHTHVLFAHCYKGQGGWHDVLARFPQGGGTLLDLEFLTDDSGRVAAFGYYAGYAGAALALESWTWQLNNPADRPMPGVTSYPSRDLLPEDVKSKVLEAESKAGDAAEGQLTFVSRQGYRMRTY
jgi:saccharopine dehydrogenase (NAD+, L-lysine forming)